MGDVVAFPTDDASLRAARDKALVDAAIEVLGTNASLAQAVQDLADVFVRLDVVVAENPGNVGERRPIDVIIEQDRQRLLTDMNDLLESISEYTSGVRARMRSALQRQGDLPPP